MLLPLKDGVRIRINGTNSHVANALVGLTSVIVLDDAYGPTSSMPKLQDWTFIKVGFIEKGMFGNFPFENFWKIRVSILFFISHI